MDLNVRRPENAPLHLSSTELPQSANRFCHVIRGPCAARTRGDTAVSLSLSCGPPVVGHITNDVTEVATQGGNRRKRFSVE